MLVFVVKYTHTHTHTKTNRCTTQVRHTINSLPVSDTRVRVFVNSKAFLVADFLNSSL